MVSAAVPKKFEAVFSTNEIKCTLGLVLVLYTFARSLNVRPVSLISSTNNTTSSFLI